MPRPLVVKVTCGSDDPERANQGLTVASTALSAGADVSVWLTGEAAWLGAGRGGFVLPHAAPAADLVAALVAGARVTVCTQCATRRELTEDDLLAGVRIAGAAAYVEEVLAPEVQALVY